MAASLTPPAPLVSADWLSEHMGHPDLVIADCRFSLQQPDSGQQAYATAHIPGAQYFHLNRDLSGPVLPSRRGGRHPLPAVADLVRTLEARGIGNQTTVVAYDDSRFAFAARLWWLLRYLGHDRVAVLDGGFAGWRDRGYPTETAAPTPTPQQFTPRVQTPWVVDRDAVLARDEDAVLVDSRSGDRYRGEREPIDPVAGHVPGAVNRFWQEVTDEQGYALPSQAQRQRWQGIDGEVMVYCGSGVTACVNLLGLALAGREPGRLYAGSWSDWCSY